MKEIDYLGTVSGYKVPDKFERTGLKAVKSNTGKIGMIFYESFSNSYYKLGEKVGKAWSEGKVFMK